MTSRKAILIFTATLLVILGALRSFVKAADAMDEKLALKTIEEVERSGYFLLLKEETGNRFRRHLTNWIDHPIPRTRVSYYDANPIQPNDTLPKFTMTLIEIVFEDEGSAYEFVKNFNNSSPDMRNGNVAEQCWNIAYVSTKQMRFNELLHRAAYPTDAKSAR
ncbi:MAG: hypothetical protein ACKVOK_15565 [Flavobacteriales bacterium]